MRLAITVWESRISPVFDTARTAMVTDIENGEAHNPREEMLPDGSPCQKVAKLRDLGVETLVCGAISSLFASLLASSGIRLIPFVSGDVNAVLQSMAAKGAPPRTFSMPGCSHGRCFRARRVRRKSNGVKKMIIAVSASGASLDAQVDARFGRAPHFIVVDSETGAFEAHDNVQNLNAAQGAGIQSAEAVCRFGAEVLITGHCGPKAYRVLQAADIKVVTGAEGSVQSVLDAYLSGQLKPSNAPDVEGHWA